MYMDQSPILVHATSVVILVVIGSSASLIDWLLFWELLCIIFIHLVTVTFCQVDNEYGFGVDDVKHVYVFKEMTYSRNSFLHRPEQEGVVTYYKKYTYAIGTTRTRTRTHHTHTHEHTTHTHTHYGPSQNSGV